MQCFNRVHDGRQRLLGALFLTACLTLSQFFLSAASAAPVPRERPAPPPPSVLLSEADGHAFWDALDAREKGRWMDVRTYARQIADPTARDILEWLRFQKDGAAATLAEIVAFQESHPHWPRQSLLSRRAEEALSDYPMQDRDVIAWFSTREPLTGEGKVRLGEAFLNTGQPMDGAAWIQRAWVEHQFSRSREAEILRKHGNLLPEQAHEDRLNRLIWEQRFADGRRMLQLVNAEARAVADARLKLSSRSRGAESALARVPAHLRADTGLLFDQARYLRRRGKEETAIPVLLTAPAPTGAEQAIARPDRWWTERKILARKALKDGHYQEAYGLATGHGHDRGVAFAEGEFLAGWIALQYLNQPDTAFTHFQTLEAGVTTPISKSRGAYWMGRAAEAAGRREEALTHYQRAAQHPTAFYGQLATARLSENGQALLQLPHDPTPGAAEGSLLANNDLVRAFELLNEAGESYLARSFVLELADTLTDPKALAALADLMVERNMPNLSVRVAKVAAGRNILLPERSYPTAVLPTFPQVGKPVEPAFVYGLSRQESEFNPEAVSHAGARGLMQLMPRTARAVARQINVPYQRSRLTEDPSYNAMLGSAHLGDLLDDFAGSYIMTIAAYNAGAHRVSQWIETYGDPRDPAVDPIDWMENIPFTETRNYVQRVMENIQVYRARLGNQTAALQIEQDIKRYDGSEPIIQVASRPQVPLTLLTAPTAPPPAVAVPTAPSAPVPHAPIVDADIPRPNPSRPVTAALTPQPAPVPAEPAQAAPATTPAEPAAAAPSQPEAALPEPELDLPAEGAMLPIVEEGETTRARLPAMTPEPEAAPVTPEAQTPVLEAPQTSVPETPTPVRAAPAPVRAQTAPAQPAPQTGQRPILQQKPPVTLIPPSGLDTPRQPRTPTASATEPQAPLEPGTMLPIPDEG